MTINRQNNLWLIWIGLRIYSLFCGLLAGRLAGIGYLEIWERWDAVYYARISANGYSATDGTTNFHPLFPLLARPIAALGVHPIIPLLLVSSLATVFVYFLFSELARIDQDDSTATKSTLLFVSWPISYVFYLPYTESIWILCAIGCLLLARREKWWSASIAAGFAVLARQQGLFLIIPLAWELWYSSNYSLRHLASKWKEVLSLILVPFSYGIWIVYRSLVVGDAKPDFSSIQTIVHSVLLSPGTNRVIKDIQFTWPWKAAYWAIRRAIALPFVSPWVDLIFGFLFLLLLILAWRNLRMSYRLYVLVITIVSFSFHSGLTATGGAYLSLPRHLVLAFPVFIGLGARWPKLNSWLLFSIALPSMTFFLFGYFWMRLVP